MKLITYVSADIVVFVRWRKKNWPGLSWAVPFFQHLQFLFLHQTKATWFAETSFITHHYFCLQYRSANFHVRCLISNIHFICWNCRVVDDAVHNVLAPSYNYTPESEFLVVIYILCVQPRTSLHWYVVTPQSEFCFYKFRWPFAVTFYKYKYYFNSREYESSFSWYSWEFKATLGSSTLWPLTRYRITKEEKGEQHRQW